MGSAQCRAFGGYPDNVTLFGESSGGVFETHDRPLSERPPPTERDRQVARIVHGCWASFARSGPPDCRGAPTWPAYDPERDELMEFGNDGPALRQGLRAPELGWNDDWFLPPLLDP